MRKKIYTAGKMKGLSFSQQMWWRSSYEDLVLDYAEKAGLKSPVFVHPPNYYNYEENLHKSDREIFDWEMMQLRSADILVVNLNDIEESVGTIMEVSAAQTINRMGGNIFILGIGWSECLHPWIRDSCLRIEDGTEGAAKYTVDYLLT